MASLRTLGAIFMHVDPLGHGGGHGWAQPVPVPTEQPVVAAQPRSIQAIRLAADVFRLVLLMTAPGLALFYGGMVRQKNALATIMQSFIMALISVQWVLWGYSLAFGPDLGGLIGGL